MSAFFSALMRSMGTPDPVRADKLAVAPSEQLAGDPATAAVSEAVEAAPAEEVAGDGPGMTREPRIRALATARPMEPIDEAVTPAGDHSAPRTVRPIAVTAQPLPIEAQGLPGTAVPAERRTGEDVVAAAMRWVATPDTTPANRPASVAAAVPVRASERIRADGVTERQTAGPAANPITVATDVSARADIDGPPVPKIIARAVDRAIVTAAPREEAQSSAKAPPAAETFEISIGAIHLRVDPPAPQVATRSAPPLPPRTAAAASSGLARRALRRL